MSDPAITPEEFRSLYERLRFLLIPGADRVGVDVGDLSTYRVPPETMLALLDLIEDEPIYSNIRPIGKG